MTPLVSILIPCYNAAPWLGATIESALAQTWPAKEIIVVNDGSTDDSLAIARSFEPRGVRVIDQSNRGQSAAFNRALREARGDFFEYLDADDLLAPDKLALQLARLASLPKGWIASGEWTRFQEDPLKHAFVPEPVWRDLAPTDWLVTSWAGGGMMHGAAWLVPRTVAEAAGLWDERLSLINDFDYFSRIIASSQGVAFCPGAQSYYRSGLSNSVSGQTSRRAWESAFLSTTLGLQTLLQIEDSPRTRQAGAINLQRLIHNAYPFSRDLIAQAEIRIRELGGCDLQPGGGRIFQGLMKVIGWKGARRLQLIGRRWRRGIHA